MKTTDFGYKDKKNEAKLDEILFNITSLKSLIFQPHQSFEPPSSMQGGIYIWARGLFCTKFNSEELLFEPFFDVMRIFGNVEPYIE